MAGKKKVAYLHVGLHKTGTTALQLWLQKNRDYLQANNLKYLEFSFLDNDCPNHSIPFYFIYSEAREKYHITIREQLDASEYKNLFRLQLETNLKTNNNIIISGEDISKLQMSELQSLKQTLIDNGFTINTVVFVRSPYTLINSLFQEYVKSNMRTPNLSHLLTEQRQDLQKISKIFNKLEIVSYDKCNTNKLGVIGTFLSILNLHPTDIVIINQNISLSQNAIRLMDHINTFEPFIINGKKNARRNNNDLIALHKICGRRFRLSESEINPLKKILEQEALFINNLTGTFFSNTIEFEEEIIWNDTSIDQLLDALEAIPNNLLVHVYSYFYTENNIPDTLRAKVLDAIKHFNLNNSLEIFVENFRDMALSIESHNLQKAIRFMKLAETIRPNGPLIKARNIYYKNLLKQ
ncbi:MAG: hypothetical protein IMY67_06150, partial [Bacteroidetes bacterium]|nr:hypothetical protein [Bacteroidota bacterium]